MAEIRRSSSSFDSLEPEMMVKVQEVIRLCQQAGISIRAISCYRDPWDQARLYRRSRSTAEVVVKIDHLYASHYHFLGRILEEVGPQKTGPWATNAGPGESFHNYGLAFDGCPFKGRTLAWDIPRDDPEWHEAQKAWQIYGICVKQAGLHWGGDWVSARDLPHCQYYPRFNPLDNHTQFDVTKWAATHGWMETPPEEVLHG